MLNEKTALFTATVKEAARQLGNNAPRVANYVIQEVFPRTCSEAEYEGAEKMLRAGVIAEIKRILRHNADTAKQVDFGEMSAEFQEVVSDLKSDSYYVESIEEYVSVADLARDVAQLDDARKYMRRKGEECIAEADRLDRLFQLVTAAE